MPTSPLLAHPLLRQLGQPAIRISLDLRKHGGVQQVPIQLIGVTQVGKPSFLQAAIFPPDDPTGNIF